MNNFQRENTNIPLEMQTPQQLAEGAGVSVTPGMQANPQKTNWINEAKRLNPSVDTVTLSRIYDTRVQASQRMPSVEEQMKNIEALNKHTEKKYGNPPVDLDKEPHGYDKSDKISMLGSALTGGKIGLEKFLARIHQLGLKVGKETGMVDPGSLDSFTKYMNRKYARDQLYQEALRQHPVITNAAEFTAGAVPLAAIPEARLGEALEGAATRGGADMIMQNLAKYLPRAATGAAVGELQYDPTGHRDTEQALTGAVANLALPYGAKLLSRLKTPLANEIAKVSEKYGIHLPVIRGAEKLARMVPFTGIGAKLAERQQTLAHQGRNLADEIIGQVGGDDYGKSLHGEVLKNYKNNQTKLENMYNQVGALAEKGRRKVKFSNLQNKIDQVKADESALPPSLQNQRLLSTLNDFSDLEDMSYNNANKVRKRLGQRLDKIRKSYRFGSASPEEKGALDQMYSGAMQDMDDYAGKGSQQIRNLHAQANKLYMDKILPFKRGQYSKFLDKNYDTDKFIGEFLQPDRAVSASRLLDILPEGKEKGLTAARGAILHQALDAADLPHGGFNPEKFINTALRLKKTNKIIFTPEQLGALEGYRNLIALTKKVSPATLAPETWKGMGLRYTLHTAGTVGGFIHPYVVLPLLLSGNVAARALNSDVGRKLLLKASKWGTQVSKSKMMPLIDKLLKIAVPKVAAQDLPQYTEGL